MNLIGAFAGVFIGALIVIIWPYLKPLGGIFELYELLPGFISSSLAVFVVSKSTAKPHNAITEQFNQMEARL